MPLDDWPEAGVDVRTSDIPPDGSRSEWRAPRLTVLGRLDSLTTLGGGSPDIDGGTATSCTAGPLGGTCSETT